MIYRFPLLAVSETETRRYAGLASIQSFPSELISTACTDGLLLAEACATWRRYRYEPEQRLVQASSPFTIHSEDVARHLQKANEVVILAVTIGSALEAAVNDCFATGDYTAGLLLDAAGTAAVEQAADEACRYLAEEAARSGLNCTTRYSPGYGDWAITDQPSVLTLSGGNKLGVTVNESCLLEPRKSVTAIVGLKPAKFMTDKNNCKAGGCASCHLTNCFARKEPKA